MTACESFSSHVLEEAYSLQSISRIYIRSRRVPAQAHATLNHKYSIHIFSEAK